MNKFKVADPCRLQRSEFQTNAKAGEEGEALYQKEKLSARTLDQEVIAATRRQFKTKNKTLKKEKLCNYLKVTV